ncbi:MAG: hypothetical protein M1820_004815 [Bogoriella megaspora]|nr:MAG: hypothetical protein M1820_004815 [Bogoriella megaspora]
MSKFALLCQAARLLGQVLENVSSESVSRDNVWVQLDRTLQSMLNASLDVRSPDYDQISFIYSTLLALYTPWLHSDSVSMNDPDSDRAQRAIAVVEQVTETISTNLIRKQCFLGRSPEDMSPWGLYFAYHICRVHMQFSRHNSNSAEIVKNLRETFLKIDARWNAAGVYLQLLEAQEVISDS